MELLRLQGKREGAVRESGAERKGNCVRGETQKRAAMRHSAIDRSTTTQRSAARAGGKSLGVAQNGIRRRRLDRCRGLRGAEHAHTDCTALTTPSGQIHRRVMRFFFPLPHRIAR